MYSYLIKELPTVLKIFIVNLQNILRKFFAKEFCNNKSCIVILQYIFTVFV